MRLWRYEGLVIVICENIVGKREEPVFDAFIDSELVEKA